MAKKPLKSKSDQIECFMPCPCLKLEPGEQYCLNGGAIHDINFVDFGFIPSFESSDKASEASLCLNMVYADNDGYIRCGTSKNLIKVRTSLISIKDYLEAIENVKELYQGGLDTECVCPECLYKTIVGIYLNWDTQHALDRTP
ncbi:MAG: hypothetical protein ACFFCD_15100 [Promethearchaeota archaeon]